MLAPRGGHLSPHHHLGGGSGPPPLADESLAQVPGTAPLLQLLERRCRVLRRRVRLVLVLDLLLRVAASDVCLCAGPEWLRRLGDDGTTLVLAYRERKSVERLFFVKLWEHFEPTNEPDAEVTQLAGSSGVEIFSFRRKRLHDDGNVEARPPPPYCVAARTSA